MATHRIASREEWTAARKALLTTYALLDMTPKGRNETGPGYNLTDWVRRHDEYEDAGAASCCHSDGRAGR
jgi:predicted dithiol-disulfide oxidoreductase (DUF899 family)